ncbi:hypothetical protein [Saccharicrinis fermentans]|nr:hypothetical protein [Saccharicrinis fermentans]
MKHDLYFERKGKTIYAMEASADSGRVEWGVGFKSQVSDRQ